MDCIALRVKNWKLYNPRTDVKKPSWFRLAHDFFDNEEHYNFSHAELLSWLYILCAASRKNSDLVTISFDRLKVVGRIKKSDFMAAVEKLVALGSIEVCDTLTLRERYAGGTDSHATYGRTDERDGGDEHARGAPPARDGSDPEADQARAWAERNDLEIYYREQFRRAHKSDPIVFPEDEAALGRLLELEGMSPQRLRKLINAFVYMEDPWFSKQGWNLRTLETDIQKINARVAA